MKVSVVIPAYNRARRLPDAIDSVLRQEHSDIEIILVDDGSTDDTREVAARYGDRVRYVWQKNAGVAAARNQGIRLATGEFVAFLDSDDRWNEHKLAVQLALFERHPEVGMVFSDFTIEGSEGTTHVKGASIWAGRELSFPEMKRVSIESIDCWVGPMYRQLLNELPILTSSVIVRRSVLDSGTWYGEDVVLFEDWEFFARLARRAAVGYVTAATAVQVGHADPGRVSKCSRLDRAESYVTLLQRVWLADATFVAQYPDELRSALGRAFLAVAREALLDGRRLEARDAVESWRSSGCTEGRAWASVYDACTRISGGHAVLRNILRVRMLTRFVTGAGNPLYGSVNPAA